MSDDSFDASYRIVKTPKGNCAPGHYYAEKLNQKVVHDATGKQLTILEWQTVAPLTHCKTDDAAIRAMREYINETENKVIAKFNSNGARLT